jgi:hypothetical protein
LPFSKQPEKETDMALQLYRLRLLLVLAAVIGAGGWVFNPSGKPAGGFVWDRYQTQKVDE